MTNKHLQDKISQRNRTKKSTDKKQRILEAAADLFAEKGYSNTSTSEIAKEAGVAEGTIFRHFETKENLLLSVLLPFLQEVIPWMAEEVFDNLSSKYNHSAEQFFRALITNRYHFFNENREIFQVYVKELVYNEDIRKKFMTHFQNEVVTRIEQAIIQFQEKGDIVQNGSPHSMAKMVFSTLFGYFLSNFVLFQEEPLTKTEEDLEQFVQFIMDGLNGPGR